MSAEPPPRSALRRALPWLALATIGAASVAAALVLIDRRFVALEDRLDASATAPLPDGRVFVIAAGDGEDELQATLRDSHARVLAELAPPTTIGHRPTATALEDGRVLIVGGEGHSRSAWLFDPRTEAFDKAPRTGAARTDHTATLLETGEVLVTGGATPGVDWIATDSAELFDPTQNVWLPLPTMTQPRLFHTATHLADGRVLIIGGLEPGNDMLTAAEVFDPTTRTFAPTAPMTSKRSFHGSALLPDGRVIVVGGAVALGTARQPLGTTELYDPTRDAWTPGPDLDTPRQSFATIPLPDGRVMVAGGWWRPIRGGWSYYPIRARELLFGTLAGPLDSTELLDPDGDGWAPGPRLQRPRMAPVLTVTSDGVVLVLGADGEPGTAERWVP